MPVTPLRTPERLPEVDEAIHRLAAVEAIAILLSLGYAGENLADAKPQLVSAAFDGIALLAADATRALHGTA